MKEELHLERNWIILLALGTTALILRIWAAVDFNVYYDGCAYIMQAQNILDVDFSLP